MPISITESNFEQGRSRQEAKIVSPTEKEIHNFQRKKFSPQKKQGIFIKLLGINASGWCSVSRFKQEMDCVPRMIFRSGFVAYAEPFVRFVEN